MSLREIDIGLELFSLLGADRECPFPIKGRDSAVANSARLRAGAALFHCPLLRACGLKSDRRPSANFGQSRFMGHVLTRRLLPLQVLTQYRWNDSAFFQQINFQLGLDRCDSRNFLDTSICPNKPNGNATGRQ